MMKHLLDSLKVYLNESLGLKVVPGCWAHAEQLPMLLRNHYVFYRCSLLDRPHLLMLARSSEEFTPATIRKHVDKVMGLCDCEVIYISETILAYNRKRLIQHKVSFAVPQCCLYVPTLGIDLHQHIQRVRKPVTESFRPATQAVVLDAVYSGIGIDNGITPMKLANRLSYTKMTLTRAFNELEAAGLAEVEMQWKERVLRFPMARKTLWSRARPFLRSPVKRQVVLPNLPGGAECLIAGESALSRYTMLASPPRPVYAMLASVWKKLYPVRQDEPDRGPDEDSVTVELWTYRPFENAGNATGCIDPLSLILSIGEPEDERVEAALEELEGKVSW